MINATVLAYFDVPTTPVFALNDSVRGKLDDVTYVLAGDIATDVTSAVRAVSTVRGRSRWLDDIQAGSAQVTFNNLDRAFDPAGGGTYSTNIVPAKRITVRVGGADVFDGRVEDWDANYSLSGDATVTATITDALGDLGRVRISTGGDQGGASQSPASFPEQLSGARIDAVLDRPEIDYPAGKRDIDTGAATVAAATIVEDISALDYLRTVTRTESGRLFAAADGTVTFRQRLQPVSPAELVTFSDDGLGVPFDDIEVQIGAELLYNRAVVQRDGGQNQIATNDASIDAYGARTLERTGLLFTSDADSAELAEYLAGTFGTPKVRVASLRVNLSRLDDVAAAKVVSLELGDLVAVDFTPPGGGAAIERYALVEGVDHSIGIDSHRVSFRLSSLDNAPFVLNCFVCGVLDGEAVLAY